VALGMNVKNNPVLDSPYVQQMDIGFSFFPPGTEGLLTEAGSFILTEDLEFITTE